MIGSFRSIAALAGASLVVAPAQARDPLDRSVVVSREAGVFAGVRLRIPLGAERGAPPRWSLGVAPLVQDRAIDRAPPPRIGEGLAVQFGEASRPRLTLGGLALTGRAPAPSGPRNELSTVGTIAVVVGGLAVLYVGAFVICQETNCLNSD